MGKALNDSKQDVEELQSKLLEIEKERSVSKSVNDELEIQYSSLVSKTEELEACNKNLAISNASLKENVLQEQENYRELSVKAEESKKQIEDLMTKEKDYNEALNSLKGINEMISKAARENEASKRDLEEKYYKIENEKCTIENIGQDLENKNIELKSQLQLINFQKKELEVHFVESQNKIAGLKEEIKQLSLAKEARVAEEKDVDESEQSAIDKNM